ncbi:MULTISPECIES: hypothetical protein [unclassified Undibacterium]|uniref:hypothetical protein n=1 Tax=unclassified Undibacterium TaxID=2630295 RepID=UPI002AC92608|nr:MULTISPECIES: hypothetical protein [unclassified Undibacterium]MEB0139010.1 hypothetical protein [Undibacterium sp. CCC2.1]MEB0171895.1 hypothetical protein [Undibacterium sp. CCC1.1]MEB0175836.1 hypothetical protein [Undibacterium sp. CCC3.4]MEB0215098.1 hypothetical protein [Undibacterium sp. 5I2]WPX45065.1 hypothetical protein RHM61_07545 [Undibacterium sp. CCC3.4]
MQALVARIITARIGLMRDDVSGGAAYRLKSARQAGIEEATTRPALLVDRQARRRRGIFASAVNIGSASNAQA